MPFPLILFLTSATVGALATYLLTKQVGNPSTPFHLILRDQSPPNAPRQGTARRE